MFISVAPLFLVKDLSASLDYYCDVLGFNRPYLWGTPPSFAMPSRDGLIVMLKVAGDGKRATNSGENWDAYFWVEDAEELFRSFEQNGAIISYPPEYMEAYGNIEFAVKDPDGYHLAFGQDARKNEKDGSVDSS